MIELTLDATKIGRAKAHILRQIGPRLMLDPATQSESAPMMESSASTAARPFFPVRLMAVLLFLLVTALYWPATRCNFISFDDPDYVTLNAHVQNGLTLENFEWAFMNPVSSNWHPVTILSHMLDCQLFGLKPWGHHLTSLLLHALNTVLVFLLLYEITGRGRRKESKPRNLGSCQ